MADGKGYVKSFIRQSVLSPIVYDSDGNEFVYFNNRGASYAFTAASAALGVDLGGGNYPSLVVQADRDDGSCPGIIFYPNSASPAANDGLFFIDCVGNNSTGASRAYVALAGLITDATNGSEDGAFYIDTYGAGTRARRIRVDADGLKFNSDSAAANALNDYEEGTFTPTLTTAGTDFTSVTYSTQTGNYTKIGNLVYVQAVVRTSAVTVGSATSTVQIGGLPFTGSGGVHTANVGFRTGWTTEGPQYGYINNDAAISLFRHSTLEISVLLPANVSSTINHVSVTAVYHTAS